MWPLPVDPRQLHPQHFGDTLPPAEMQGGIERASVAAGPCVSLAMQASAGKQSAQAHRGAVVGCATPVLCRTGVLNVCNWPACCGVKGRG